MTSSGTSHDKVALMAAVAVLAALAGAATATTVFYILNPKVSQQSEERLAVKSWKKKEKGEGRGHAKEDTEPLGNGEEERSEEDGIAMLIGNTPLLLIPSLSRLCKCSIYGKAEFLNGAGNSTKDRVALEIIRDAEELGFLRRPDFIQEGEGEVEFNDAGRDTIFEGTVGSTGISLAVLSRARGYHCHIVMPDDVAKEKRELLERLGAKVELVRPCSIVDPGHFVNIAKRRAEEMNAAADLEDIKEARILAIEGSDFTTVGSLDKGKGKRVPKPKRSPRGYFCNQFENLANFQAHFRTSGPEIYQQTDGGKFDAFVMGAGTGGTISGISHYLKPLMPNLKVCLADPQGSGLFNKVKFNTMYAGAMEAEGSRRRHQIDTIIEGVGITRITENFKVGLPLIDEAFKVSDQEAVEMGRFLLKEDGLFVGSSSCVNLVASVKMARKLGEGCKIVTILCDSGSRHLTKFYNDEFLRGCGLDPEHKTGLLEKV